MNKLNSADIARFISNISSPIVVAPLATLWIFSVSYGLSLEALIKAIIFILILELPSLTYILVQMKRGKIKDIHVKNRKMRYPIYLIGFMSMLFAFIYLSFINAPRNIYIILISLILAFLISFLINFLVKVSIHTLILGGLSSLFLIYEFNFLFALFLIITAVVMWARVQIKAHTSAEVTIGGILGMIVMYAIFSILV